jgi:hypothetical protein
MRSAFALCLMTGFALPAAAENAVPASKGCVLVATMQDDHCAVQNYQCTGAGKVAFKLEVLHGGGQVEVHTFDAKHGGLEIRMPSGGNRYKFVTVGDHPRVTLETGSSRKIQRATIHTDKGILKSTTVTDYSYGGETRELAGTTFHRLNYAATLNFPELGSALHTSGSVLFNEKLDLLVNEVEISDGEGGPARKIKLRSLSLKGQKGFDAKKPKFGC